VDILHEFANGFRQLEAGGDVTLQNGTIELTRQGLLHADRLLPVFFEPEYQQVRYT
jgi:oxygen-independent coproporphyrinogen-3 oxidase